MAIIAPLPGVVTLGSHGCSCAECVPSTEFLSDTSPKDKPWDIHRANADLIEAFHRLAGFKAYAERMSQCSGRLVFKLDVDLETGETFLKLKSARFCRVRTCTVCNWRRSLLWTHRALSGLPGLMQSHPLARFILLTLTVPNPPIEMLRATLKAMSTAWHRFQRFPEMRHVLGWIRTTEVTLGKTGPGRCHPHYHALLMVEGDWFSNHYTTRDRWRSMWRQAMRDDSITQVDVRAIKPKAGAGLVGLDGVSLEFYSALPEVLKYATKPADFLEAGVDWFKMYVEQVHRQRFLATGGILKDYLKEDITEQEMLTPEGEQPEEDDGHRALFMYDWNKPDKRYKRARGIL